MQEEKKKGPVAGGVFLALGMPAGAIIGGTYGQASIGFLIGLGVGVVIALAIWLMDRN